MANTKPRPKVNSCYFSTSYSFPLFRTTIYIQSIKFACGVGMSATTLSFQISKRGIFFPKTSMFCRSCMKTGAATYFIRSCFCPKTSVFADQAKKNKGTVVSFFFLFFYGFWIVFLFSLGGLSVPPSFFCTLATTILPKIFGLIARVS